MSAKLGWLDENKPEDSAPRSNCTEKISEHRLKRVGWLRLTCRSVYSSTGVHPKSIRVCVFGFDMEESRHRDFPAK
jgi:hypothetical protein